MADFFSQFQVHPPQDFNLGGFQQQPGMDMSPDKSGWATPPPMHDAGTGMGFTDPRASTLPQPYQQGPKDMTVLPSGQQFPDFMNGMKATDPPFMPQRIDQGGFTSGSIGNGGGTQGPFTLGGGPISQQINQTGFYAPPAVNMGSNGPQQVPANPSQQSGALGSPMVQMTGPDGSQQFVDPQHVPHYQGLGAQVTGQQLAGMSGSSYGGG